MTTGTLVVDNTAPLITTCATNRTISADAMCQAVVPDLTAEVVATDNCSAVTVTQSPAAGSSVGLGDTIVTLSAADGSGNTNTCTATLQVVDTTAPSITTCATNRTISADAMCQAQIPDLTAEVVAADNCSAVTVTQSPAAGTSVGLGDTIVTLSAADASGNTNTCTATLQVVDTTAPSITTCATNRTVSADAMCQAVVPDLTAEVVATDNCSAVTVTQSPAAGTSVGLGDTIVTLSAADTAGNTNTCTATLQVVDTTAPSITTCATNRTISADAMCQAVVPDLTAEVVATDNCGAVTVTQSPAAGTSVGLGDTIVTLSAADVSGNTNTCTAALQVVDTTAPSITTCATNRTISADAMCQAVVPDLTAEVVATDNCSAVTVTQSPAAGTSVGLGDTIVTLSAADVSGNTNTCTATLQVVDTTAPSITTCATNRTISADAMCQAVVPDLTAEVVATDNCSAVTVTQSPAAGTSVGLGDTIVTLSAADVSGNTNTCTATLQVVDTTAPSITTCATNRTISADAMCQAVVPDLTAEVVATDNCSAVTVTQSPAAGTSVGLGDTIVTLSAADAAGNTNTCTATLQVVVNTPPAPLLSNPMLVGTTFSVSVATVPCTSYVLEFKNDLSDGSWTPLSPVPGDGTVKVLQDSNATGERRFYRVRVD